MLFSGFRKCLYPTLKFDSDSERRFAVILENDKEVLKWFRPTQRDLKIYYANDLSYEPDFVVETGAMKLICETKRADELEDKEVRAKAKAAAEWCRQASAHEKQHDGKPWKYLLIPHDIIKESKTLQGFVASYIYS
jgi:type III restriction enzyme